MTTGNVGIGTTAPAVLLHTLNGNVRLARNNGNFNLRLGNEDGDATPRTHTINIVTSDQQFIITASNTDTRFHHSSNAPILLAPTGGNVGIGTTSPSPSTKLDVNGVIKSAAVSTASVKIVCAKTDGTLGYCTSSISGTPPTCTCT